MLEYILDNGVKIIYKNIDSKLTSICIGLDAGAARDGDILGLAHATEHMVFKGTKTRSEHEINNIFDKYFAFHNAMTNYPYVIYYGSLLEEDIEIGLDILSDILINPSFPYEGFEEEMSVIMQELKEWDEDIEQYCEDKLFFNAFEKSRLKYPIIGDVEGLRKITLSNLKEFYEENYFPQNTSITVLSSLDFESVKNIISKFFGNWLSNKRKKSKKDIEEPKKGTFIHDKDGIKVTRVEMIFSIKDLSYSEIKALKLFDGLFCDGSNSILFDELRTKRGLVYDISSVISHESDIKLYKIMFTTSKENYKKAIKIVKECIKNYNKNLDYKKLEEISKRIKLKQLFKEEQNIQLAKEISTYSVMFNDYKVYENMVDNLENVLIEDMLRVANNVLKNSTIQVIKPRRD